MRANDAFALGLLDGIGGGTNLGFRQEPFAVAFAKELNALAGIAMRRSDADAFGEIQHRSQRRCDVVRPSRYPRHRAVKGIALRPGQCPDRDGAQRRQDLLGKDALVILDGARLALRTDHFGHPAFGQIGNGDRAGFNRPALVGLVLGGIGTATDGVESFAGFNVSPRPLS